MSSASERQRLSIGHMLLLVTPFTFLLFAVVWASMAWTSEDVTMSIHGWIALGLGTFFSLLIGCGLMALMFYSSRSVTILSQLQMSDVTRDPISCSNDRSNYIERNLR